MDLRTLVFGHRKLPREEFDTWIGIYQAAQNAVNDREMKVEFAAELIEKDLIMDGVTAIEDK